MFTTIPPQLRHCGAFFRSLLVFFFLIPVRFGPISSRKSLQLFPMSQLPPVQVFFFPCLSSRCFWEPITVSMSCLVHPPLAKQKHGGSSVFFFFPPLESGWYPKGVPVFPFIFLALTLVGFPYVPRSGQARSNHSKLTSLPARESSWLCFGVVNCLCACFPSAASAPAALRPYFPNCHVLSTMDDPGLRAFRV